MRLSVSYGLYRNCSVQNSTIVWVKVLCVALTPKLQQQIKCNITNDVIK